jgi:hypothetical protein
MASEPVPPLLGNPTLGPGWLESTAPPLVPPPPAAGGARTAPASSVAPRPTPLRPKPEPVELEPPPTDGGGGTILLASSAPRGLPALPPVLPVPPFVPESEGGGATTLGMPTVGAVEDEGERVPVLPDNPADGGGAITFEPSVAPMPLRVPRGLPPAALAPTAGGGGTTLAASNDPFPPLGPLE